jgi:hypothetical protein
MSSSIPLVSTMCAASGSYACQQRARERERERERERDEEDEEVEQGVRPASSKYE